MKKISLTAVLLLMMSALLSGCSGTDVVKQYSQSSFQTIIKQYPELAQDHTKTGHEYDLTYDGETILRISNDYKQSGINDIILETPLKPFTDAGLKQTNLAGGYQISGETLKMVTDFGDGDGKQNNIADSLFESVKTNRSVLTYHQKLDHFGVKLSEGKFEWAKDYQKNDKDIVFVLRAQPLQKMGVDTAHVSGWTFTTVQDTDGSNVDVILKAYNLDKNAQTTKK
jgi:hypothetical protein